MALLLTAINLASLAIPSWAGSFKAVETGGAVKSLSFGVPAGNALPAALIGNAGISASLLSALPNALGFPDGGRRPQTGPGRAEPSHVKAYALGRGGERSRPLLEEFNAFRQRFFDQANEFSPEHASWLGLRQFGDKLGDWSPESISRYVGQLEEANRELEDFEPRLEQLGPQEKIDHAVLRSFIRSELRYLRDRREYRKDVGLALYPVRMLEKQLILMPEDPEKAEAEMRRVAARVEALPRFLEQVRSRMREGLVEGQVADRRAIERDGIKTALNTAKFLEEALPAQVAEKFPALAQRLRAAGQAAGQSYREFAAFMENEELPKASDSFALGREEYESRLRSDYFIHETAERLKDKALQEAAHIRESMDDLAQAYRPGAALGDIIAEMRKQHPRNDAELLAAYSGTMERAREFVTRENIFAIPSDYAPQLESTPSSLRSLVAMAMVVVPPLVAEGHDGAFLVTPSDGKTEVLERHRDTQIAPVTVHEAFPGHLWQIREWKNNSDKISPLLYLLRNERGNYFGASLNFEGYALYVEELLEQHGFFAEIPERLTALQNRLWRVWRVIIDIGLQTGTMGFDEAVETLAREAFVPKEMAETEIYRYTTWPTQAMTYMVGSLELRALKEAYKEAVGDGFTEQGFHEALLSYGPAQPSLIHSALIPEVRRGRADSAR